MILAMKATLFSLCSLLSVSALCAEMNLAEVRPENQEFVVNLKDPEFTSGVVKTDKGGVVTAPGLRIQAKSIEYYNKIEHGVPVKRIVAEGDLMMEYLDRVFVGEKLEYDFVSKTGTLTQGKTFVNIWFIGGEEIRLNSDGSFVIYNGYITTSESQENTWEIKADAVKITRQHLLSARDIRFRFAKIPIFWLPSFKSNLKFFRDTPVRYKVLWDKGLGPRLSLRYRIYSWENFAAYLRFDYRITRGPGGAIETEYYSPDERTTFLTRSYGAYDKSFPNENGWRRYRFQGLFAHASKDERTHIHLQYDKFSDERMVSDFKSEDFEINTQKRSRLLIDHREDNVFGTLSLQPRINSFQSINQELPYVAMGIRPFSIGKTGIVSQNFASVAYLDYAFIGQLHPLVKNQHAARVETRNNLYRPTFLGPVMFSPMVGIVGIFYNNNFNRSAVGQVVGTYGGNINTRISRSYGVHKHLIEPYVSYLGYTHPKAAVNDHFIFDIEDGYTHLNLVRVGVKNSIYSKRRSTLLPTLWTDIYTYATFQARSFHRTFPKIYGAIQWNLPSVAFHGGIAWNIQEHVLDYGNILGLWTINASLALGLEYRHRSKFDWRKADHENFVVDFARTLEDLLASPMSDRRNTFLTRAHLRITPRWEVHLQSHHGWGRKTEPNYNGIKIDLFNMFTSTWQLRLGYEYTPNDPFRVTAGFKIIK